MEQHDEHRRVCRVDYRNASYEGGMVGRKRDGFGLLLTDQGELLIGTAGSYFQPTGS